MRFRSVLRATLVVAIVAVGSFDVLANTAWGRRQLVRWAPDGSSGPPANDAGTPRFAGADLSLPRINVFLVPVTLHIDKPVDLVVTPPHHALVATKTGRLSCLDLRNGEHRAFQDVDVESNSELGLLGLALHPDWPTDNRMYVSKTVTGGAAALSRVVMHRVDSPRDPCAGSWSKEVVLLEVEQPYANHNGGQIRFGNDRMLYWGLGDGGYRGDPHEAGQNPTTWLGKILRVDVSTDAAVAPPDNPHVGDAAWRPEIWASGLRNPWRFDLLADGRALVGDVGQDAWEEVDVVQRGDNLGWNICEGSVRYDAADPAEPCPRTGLVGPVWTYGRDRGVSVTGGVVGRGDDALKGQFAFGDFATGRLWSLDPVTLSVSALGQFNVRPSAFARDDEGKILLLDYSGAIWRIEAPKP